MRTDKQLFILIFLLGVCAGVFATVLAYNMLLDSYNAKIVITNAKR